MRFFGKAILVITTLLISCDIYGQALTCEVADLLCSINELDNFSSTMPSSNPNDEPAPLCPGSPGSDGNPQNMTWFAFIAGSSSATLELNFSNCQGGPGGNGSAIQYGVYTDCTFSEYLTSACEGDPQSISAPIIVNIDGMVPGDDYFFFIDGDVGTYCDYSIDVISGIDPPPIPQPTGLNCISSNCPSDGNICSLGETFTFEPEGLDLSVDYIWTITPSPPNGTTINGNNDFSATFNSAGEYEICVIGDNGCTQSDPVCYTLNVLEADAGQLTADPETLCPGQTSTVSVTGYIESPPLEQALIAVGPDGNVIDVVMGETMMLDFDECGIVTVYSYNYNPTDSPALPNIGDSFTEPNCNDSCCDVESIEVNFEDNEPPTLSNTPADVTLACNEPIPDLMPVDWTDNCDGTGMVDGMQEDNYDVCSGGTITRTWTYVDGCMNEVEYIQTITINAQDGGTFDSEPEDMTFDCEADIPPPTDLNWTGDCEGTAVVSPTDSGDADLCAGGQVTRTWSHTDACGGFTEYVQTFTINPANPGEYVDPPVDVTVECDLNDLAPMTDLTWMGDCDGTAMVSGTEDMDFESCSGGTITRFWTYTDGCGQVSEHTQTITVSPAPLAQAVNPPPQNVTYNCDEIPASFPNLDFTNNQAGDCSIMGTVEPEIMGDPTICGGQISVIWLFTDDCFNVSSFVQNITILPAAEPEFIDPPADMTISCVETFPTPEDLGYTNNQTGGCEISGTVEPMVTSQGDICGGDIMSIWEFTDECGVTHTHTQAIIIEPLAEPEFIDAPDDITVSCADGPEMPQALTYTNNETGVCEISGSVDPTSDGTYDVCGGTITNTWEFTDQCGRNFIHEQIVTVGPAPEPNFTTLPTDITIQCDEIPPSPPSLSYENGGSGVCEIIGNIDPAVNDNSNSCGGTIEYMWEFTDPCGRLITHSQIITIEEAPAPEFTSLPADVSVDCGNLPAPAGPLDYTNGDPCEIMGSVDPIIDDSNAICGGEIINTWEFTDECGRQLIHVQTVTINPAPQAEFQNLPENSTVACGDDATNPGALEYTNNGVSGCLISGSVMAIQSGGYDACGGEILFTWEFTDECNRVIQHVQTIVVEPASQAAFIDPPADITVSCADFNPNPPSLSYSNNESDLCEISGNVAGQLIGNPGPCGSDVTYRWEFIDDCGRSITHNQVVTIEEAPAASFINPPADQTLNCDEVSSTIPTLNYSNGANGVCLISGVVSGIQSGFFDECGGNITYSWTFTDACNRSISHSQSISVNPAENPVFIDPPADITLECGEDFPVDPPLDYTNNSTGLCVIAGTVVATSMINGPITSYTWSYTNDCNGATISHTQNVTGVPTPDISIDPSEVSICIGDDFDLSSINVTDVNGNPFDVSFEDSNGTLLGNSIVNPSASTTYTIIATNDSGCSDEAVFSVNIDQPTNAGMDGSGQVCGVNQSYNLFDYLNGNPDPGGTWFDTDGSGVNIDNPFAVNFNGVPSGTYTFTYTVFSTNSCPDATALVEIEVISELEFEILSVECAPGGTTYNVNVFSNGYTIFSSAGDVSIIDGNNVVVTNIPAGELVVISAIDQSAFCVTDIFVNPPDCDCPEVDSPISDGDIEICEGETMPELSVQVNAGFNVNWYEDQTAQDPLMSMSNTFIPMVSQPGVYTYYAEAVDEDGCVSLIRTPVTLTINALPEVMNIEMELCADEDGNVNLNLQSLNGMINGNANFLFVYYENATDAENGSNPLDDDFTTNSSITIFALTTNTSGCSSLSEVQITVNLLPTYTIEIADEVCFGNGDGMVTITDLSPINSEISLDGINFQSITSITDLAPEEYTLWLRSDEGCIVSQPFTIVSGLQLNYSDLIIDCDDNGTSATSDDDFYSVKFEIFSSSGSAGMVQVSSATEDFGMFEYGMVDLTIDAGMEVILSVADLDSGCSIMIDLGELTSCSTSCILSMDQLEFECDDNATSTDPEDDNYIITLNASAVNGASNNTFNVLVDGNIVANFEYNIGGMITIPADGQNAVITLSDNEDNQCFVTETIGPLNPCSEECTLTIDNQNFICNSNGTIGITEDDTYEFSFTILATNSASATFFLFVDGSNVGTFNYGELSNFILMAADGYIPIIEFIDAGNENCTISLNAPELNTCSGSCSVTATLESIFCFNENTSDDPSDDSFTAEISVDLVGGSGMWQIVSTGETGSSGQMITVGPFLISDGDVELEIIDLNVMDCGTSLLLVPPLPCSACEETVEAGADVELNCDITSIQLMGTPSTPASGNWTGPGGFLEEGNEVTVDVPGTYFFTVDFGDSCLRVDSVEVTVSDDIPQVITESPLVLTCLVDSVLLTASIIGGSGNFTYQWTDENASVISTNLELMVGQGGNYFLEVFDIDSDCTSPPMLLEVKEDYDLPSAEISVDPADVLDCVVSVIYLTSEDQPNVRYQWKVDDVAIFTESLTIVEASMIELLAIDTLTGCLDSSILEITNLEEYPIVSITDPEELDCFNEQITLDGSSSQSGDNIEYTWLDADGNVLDFNATMLSIEDEGYYYLQLVDTMNKCTNIDSVFVSSNFDYPITTLEDEQEIECDQTIAELEVVIDGDLSDFSLTWSTVNGSIVSGDQESVLNIDSPGTYFVNVLNLTNQCETLDTINVVLPDLISSSQISVLDESCEESDDGVIEIQNVSGGTAPFQYFFNGALIADPMVENLSAGSYLISIIDDNGCTYDSTITIEVLDAFEVDLAASITLNTGEVSQLNVEVNIPDSEIGSVSWFPNAGLSCTDCLTPIVTAANEEVVYLVTVTDINGCQVEASIQLLVVDRVIITAPNAFSPNNDNNENENFTIYSNTDGVIINSLHVFDRWGNLVFSKEAFPVNDPNQGWDGKFGTRDVESGVFVYYSELLLPGGEIEIKKGDVTVIK
ncbi:MAG: gliding motility-associated C-terminal domain-containing protein [Bacteroidota bacterium]